MRDSLTFSAYGAGYCVSGEPTGDDKPFYDWPRPSGGRSRAAAAGPTRPFRRVCVECELNPADRRAAAVPARIIPLYQARRAA